MQVEPPEETDKAVGPSMVTRDHGGLIGIREDSMEYEIDFIGVGNRTLQDADAICFRWQSGCDQEGNPEYKIGIYDGGLLMHSIEMTGILNRYYFNDPFGVKKAEEKIIDFVCVSHPDPNHTVGILQILECFTVKGIYMNRPWLYCDELRKHTYSRRINLAKRLREVFGCIADIEDCANERGVPIYEAFAGTEIENCFRVLSPDKNYYFQLLLESGKTPLATPESMMIKKRNSAEAISTLMDCGELVLSESWTHEELQEGGFTSPENQSSIVLLGSFDKEGILLTGDAGIQALDKAIDYADSIGVSLKSQVGLFQIPHHGDRRNVSPSILDRLLGPVLPEGSLPERTALVSAAKSSPYPHRMVTNAFLRRGVNPQANKAGETVHHQTKNMPACNGITAQCIPFVEYVEG